MNRNERVENFPKSFLKKIFSKVKKYELGKYPNQSLIYNKLSKFLKIKSEKLLLTSGGVSPYYRGTDCNFWALYDNNPHLVGATIHMLSKGLDSGPMLYHALSNLKSNPFEYTMSTVKSAFHSIVEQIKDKSKEIRYSKKVEFNEEVVKNYFSKSINLNSKQFNLSLLKSPYFYSE